MKCTVQESNLQPSVFTFSDFQCVPALFDFHKWLTVSASKITLGYAMAVCSYTRRDSPYFWLQWGSGNHRVNQSSGVRLNEAGETNQ
jgi:hypothetical protein